jgi:hypothetical protein
LNDPIIHTPYDLGLGFQLGSNFHTDANSAIRVGTICLMESCNDCLNLFWELEGADKPILLIEFDHALVSRVLDETWNSTETDSNRWRGIDGSFARVIEGSEYPTHPDLLKTIHPDAKHYAFVTSDDCVDVIALDPPRAKLIEVEEIAQHRLQFPLPENGNLA